VLGRLVIRNLFRGGARSILGALAVAASLVVNAVFLTYASDVASQAKYLPGQPRLVLVTSAGGRGLEPGRVLSSGSAQAAERVWVTEGFVGTTPFNIWVVAPGTRLAIPRLAAGEEAGPAGVVVPKALAEAMDLSVGSVLPAFVPQASGAEDARLAISGISDDPLWPFIIATADSDLGKIISDEGASVLAQLAPGATAGELSRRMEGELRVEVQPLESLGGQAGGTTMAEALKAQLASIILIVATLGVVNHVMLSMLERRHQAGLLRAIGVSWSAVAVMYLAEALLIVVGGTLLAFGVVYAGGWLLPGRLATGLPGSVMGGAKVALVVCLAVSGVVVFAWRNDTPLSVLRKRPA